MGLEHTWHKKTKLRSGIAGLTAALLWLFAVAPCAYPAPENPSVLLINSYHQGFEWTDSVTAGVVDFFKQTGRARLSIEYMDSKNYELSTIAAAFSNQCAIKYGQAPPDLVLCSDNNALAFLLEHRDALFPDIPIVFCGINDFTPEMLAGASNITGVVETPSYRETVELALQIQPKARRVYAVACSAMMSGIHIQRFMESCRPLEDRVEIIPLHDLTLEEFRRELRQVAKSDIIVNLALHRTRDQKILSSGEAYAFIREQTEAPVYNLWSAYLHDHSRYIMGGVMVDGEAQGRLSAQMAAQILAGTNASDLPVVTESPNVAILNYRELERLGAAHHPHPANAVIVNCPFSFYETYCGLVWTTVAVIAGMLTLIAFLFLNIRKRRRVESELRTQRRTLREREENLRVTLGSIAEAVIATDMDGNVRHLNPIAEKLTGWPNAEARNQPITQILNLLDAETRAPMESPVKQVASAPDSIVYAKNAVFVARDGREYRIAGSGAPIRDGQGNMIGVVLVFRDVTDELALQEKLRNNQKMDAIGQLAGGIAHDFNNMLGGIISATEMAQIELDQQKDPSDLLKMVLDSAGRAAALISKLLAFARRHPLATTPTEIRRPIQDALALFAATADKRVRVHADLPEEDLYVMGDLSQLQNAFLNLFINASHAMPAGGDLDLSWKTVELDRAQCEASAFAIQPGPFIEIEIADTGIGIPESVLPRIFEPFFTTKEIGKGTGMGLSVVLGTVQQHNGAIAVDSEPEAGTRFRILLPLTDRRPQEPDAEGHAPFCGTGTILIADDEEVMRKTSQAILENMGYEVLLAENGAEALELYQNKAGRIDLVILDMVMPEMNGRDCFFAIRRIDPRAKVVIASGYAVQEELHDLQQKGLAGTIHKPFRIQELCGLVASVLSSDFKS
ncbi:ABC transporter substrate binding protein [Pontiella sp.]|uniref:hybrid sensor histidine kinase/response regulator n=1 Tax=Pontiella sp. TaxID=2837462 RepID=UPI00356AF5C9